MVCGPTERPERTFMDNIKLMTLLLTANINYCHSRKVFTSFLPIPFSDGTPLALQLISELNSYTGFTSLVN